nr:tape measure protein [Brucella anthropi]
MATDLEKLVVQLAADVKQFERTFNRAVGVSNQKMSQIERRAGLMSKNIEKAINGISFRSLNAALGTVGAAFGAREIAAYADEWTRAGNLIRAAATSAGVEVRSLDELKDGANDARTSLTSYVDLYARFIRSASGVAKSEEEIALATNLVSKAMKAGGASAAEQAGAILQLGQAIGSGVLQGDELRSLRDNAPILAQAIADEFGTVVGNLKQLGAEGKLTADRVFRAILNAQKPIEAQFKATNATIADAFTQVNNEFLAYIGNADASAGASAKLVTALQYVADNFKDVADVAATFATVIITALTGRALGGLAASLVTALGSLGKFLTALRTGVPIATSFAAALGPIGLLAGAAAAAVLLLYNNMGSGDSAAKKFTDAIAGNEVALKNAASASKAYQAELVKQIALQLEALKSQSATASAEAYTAVDRASRFRAMTGLRFEPLEYAANTAETNAMQLEEAVIKLEQQKKRADAILASTPSGYGGGIATTPDDKKKGRTKRTPAEKFDRDLQNITDRTTALVAETEAMRQLNPLIDDYGYAIEKARTEQELLNAAQKAGVAITPELRAQIAETANQWALASAEANKLAEAHDKIRQRAEEWRDTEKDAVRGVVDDLIAGKSAADAFADALDKILSKLLDFAFDGIFDSLGSGGGSIWGAIGSLFTGKKYANGTNNARGGWSLVGERGPEIVNLPRGAQVIPNHKLTAPTLPSIQGARQSASSGAMRVDVGVSVDNDGNLQAYVQNVSRKTSQSAIRSYDKTGPARLKRDSRQANMRGMV